MQEKSPTNPQKSTQLLASLFFLFCTLSQAQAEDRGQYLHWDYKVGGEERLRYEYKQNFDLNKSKKDTGADDDLNWMYSQLNLKF